MNSMERRAEALQQEDPQVGALFMLDAIFLMLQEQDYEREWRRFNT